MAVQCVVGDECRHDKGVGAGHVLGGGAVDQIAVLDRAHAEIDRAADRFGRIGVRHNVSAPGARFPDDRAHLLFAVLQVPDRVIGRGDAARRQYLALRRAFAQFVARRAAAFRDPSAMRERLMPPSQHAQATTDCVRGRTSPCPPVWLSAIPDGKMRGPRTSPASTASASPPPASARSRAVIRHSRRSGKSGVSRTAVTDPLCPRGGEGETLGSVSGMQCSGIRACLSASRR